MFADPEFRHEANEYFEDNWPTPDQDLGLPIKESDVEDLVFTWVTRFFIPWLERNFSGDGYREGRPENPEHVLTLLSSEYHGGVAMYLSEYPGIAESQLAYDNEGRLVLPLGYDPTVPSNNQYPRSSDASPEPEPYLDPHMLDDVYDAIKREDEAEDEARDDDEAGGDIEYGGDDEYGDEENVDYELVDEGKLPD